MTYWQVDEKLTSRSGKVIRFRKKRIPTKEQAMALAAKARTEAFEDKFFDRQKKSTLTVREIWDLWVTKYGPLPKRGRITFTLELPPDFLGPVHREVLVPDALRFNLQPVVSLLSC